MMICPREMTLVNGGESTNFVYLEELVPTMKMTMTMMTMMMEMMMTMMRSMAICQVMMFQRMNFTRRPR
jgi:hypothetical protein